ncbi:MAG: PAS domain S-box protein [Ignavibacteriales bacterium]|nr:PAS domain S-box protein [Ignavibacteriales bacterium]
MPSKAAARSSRYGKIFDLLSEYILVTNDRGLIIDSNNALESLLSRAPTHAPISTVFDLFVPEERERCARLLSFQGDELSLRSTWVLDGIAPLDVEILCRRLSSNGKKLVVLFAKDITDQRRKELDLLRFSEVMQHTVNPIEITDASGRIIFVNPAFERVSGYTQEELLGKNPGLLNSGKHSHEFWKAIWETILDGKEWVGQVQNKRKSGELFYTELVISPIIDDYSKVVGFLGAHRDITEQKMLEEQLVRSQKLETFGTLAAGIAHEVGNPLTSISSIVQVIQRTSKDEFAQEKLELVKNQVNRIAKIIRELVDFSRPSAYEVKLSNVNAIIRDAMNIVQYGKKVHDFIFELELDDPLPHIAVVPDQLVQVFLNILMNAVDACALNKGHIRIVSRNIGGAIAVTIQDNGHGIAEEDRNKIFDPFFTTKEVGKGTGLGLWVSLGIVKNFGGDIRVESQPGTGSTFTIELPLKGTADVG